MGRGNAVAWAAGVVVDDRDDDQGRAGWWVMVHTDWAAVIAMVVAAVGVHKFHKERRQK